MLDKGYPHPLYTLDRIGFDEDPPDDPRYALATPGGRLVIARSLRRRADNLTVGRLETVLAQALALHMRCLAGFAALGLGAAWADSMAHWRDRLAALHSERLEHEGRLALGAEQRRVLRHEAARVWRRLVTSAKLASCAAPVTGRPPHSLARLRDGLRQAGEQLRDDPAWAQRLVDHGLGPVRLAALQHLPQALDDAEPARLRDEHRRRELSAALSVVRGALLGDVLRLCRAADLVVPRGAPRELLRPSTLLPGR